MPRSLLSHSLFRTFQASLTERLHMPYSLCVRYLLLVIFPLPRRDSNVVLDYLNVGCVTGEAVYLDTAGLNGGTLHIPGHDSVL